MAEKKNVSRTIFETKRTPRILVHGQMGCHMCLGPPAMDRMEVVVVRLPASPSIVLVHDSPPTGTLRMQDEMDVTSPTREAKDGVAIYAPSTSLGKSRVDCLQTHNV